MKVVRLDDPAAFLELAGPWLLEDEARHNLILGVAGTARDHPGVYPEYHAWVVVDEGVPVAAATRTPPYALALAAPRSPAALARLVEGIDEHAPHAVGAQPEIEEFALAWATRTSSAPRLVLAQGIYRLESVRPVPPASGRLRPQRADDTDLLVEWLHAFEAEAHVGVDQDPARARRIVEQRLEATRAGMAIWEDAGRPVSTAGFGGETANGVRIGPVYTPPELRGRGYATALVAELSASLLAQGRRFCFLYTDLANPTSNAIYERIGYVRVCESAEIAFA